MKLEIEIEIEVVDQLVIAHLKDVLSRVRDKDEERRFPETKKENKEIEKAIKRVLKYYGCSE